MIDAEAVVGPLDEVTVSDVEAGGYDREAFGPAWTDIDRNGCDPRNDIRVRGLADRLKERVEASRGGEDAGKQEHDDHADDDSFHHDILVTAGRA